MADGDPCAAGGTDLPEGGAGASGQSGSALPGSQSAAVVRPPRASATTAEDKNATTARTDVSLYQAPLLLTYRTQRSDPVMTEVESRYFRRLVLRMDFEYRSAQ